MKKLFISYTAFLAAVLLLMAAVDNWTGIYRTPDRLIPNAVTEGWENVT